MRNFFCYSPKLKKELKGIGIEYNWCDAHSITKKPFWVYEITPELKEYLDNRPRAKDLIK